MTVVNDVPEFAYSLDLFKKFIASQELPVEICWVFKEDIIVTQAGGILLREPVPEENIEHARTLYDRARRAGFGVMLDVFCVVGNELSCCYVWVPNSVADAERMLVNGVKFAVPDNPPKATPVRFGVRYVIARLLDAFLHRSSLLREVPSRSGL